MTDRFIITVLLTIVTITAHAEETTTTLPTPAPTAPALTPPLSPWTNESEVAIVQTTGNSETESYSAKQASSKKVEQHTYSAKAGYLKTAAKNNTTGKNEETARKWDAGLRFETILSEKWSSFLAYMVESDKYAGYTQRHNSDVGAKYSLYANEHQMWIAEAGFRYVHQNNLNDTQVHYNAGRAYLEANYKMNETNSVKASVEYIPYLDSTSDDYQVNSLLSLSSALSTMFSLKVSYEVKTDNLPVAGAEKTDSKLTTALVAKF